LHTAKAIHSYFQPANLTKNKYKLRYKTWNTSWWVNEQYLQYT